jgi:TonB family protein
VGRALSWSLAGHLAFIVSFLLLSATRQPLTIPQVVRPVRLVAYLEPAAAPRPREAPRLAPEVARPAPPVAEPRALPQPAVSIPAAPAAPLPAAASRVAIPTPERTAPAPRSAPTPAPAESAPAGLRDRLARRLAAAAPAEAPPPELVAPKLASLPPPEAVVAATTPDRAAAGAPAPPGAVAPVGYFPHAWYLAMLKKEVFARWSPPAELFQGSRSPVALVSFRIDRAGAISTVALKESSGAARFDRSALAAVQGLGRVPALPEQYAEEALDVVIRFQNQK